MRVLCLCAQGHFGGFQCFAGLSQRSADCRKTNRGDVREENVVGNVCGGKCLHPVDCDPPGFSVRERGSLGKNTGGYWPILVTLLEHYISCCPNRQLP